MNLIAWHFSVLNVDSNTELKDTHHTTFERTNFVNQATQNR
ncbi:hypothetical protein VCHA48O429_20300 [Vibrio chagasii]|nr:hypothetical protein VCHA39P230_20300 [Vibrio chagasii]CAH7416018.1 hypothetical protein VCHA48O429_20300 [Vibrio chagasii]